MTNEERKALVERLRKQAYFADRSAEDAFNEATDQIEADGKRIAGLEAALRGLAALALGVLSITPSAALGDKHD